MNPSFVSNRADLKVIHCQDLSILSFSREEVPLALLAEQFCFERWVRDTVRREICNRLVWPRVYLAAVFLFVAEA